MRAPVHLVWSGIGPMVYPILSRALLYGRSRTNKTETKRT